MMLEQNLNYAHFIQGLLFINERGCSTSAKQLLQLHPPRMRDSSDIGD